MKELPFVPNKAETEKDAPPDPEKIGDLLLRYELPQSEPKTSAVPLAAEQDPARLRLRNKLPNLMKSPETGPASAIQERAETPPALADLPETHFDRRHEIIDQEAQAADETTVAAPQPASQTPDPAAQVQPPSVAPPMMPPVVPPAPTPSLSPIPPAAPTNRYRKPIVFGVGAGIIIGVILVILYLR